ncbi:MAG: glucose 1-dehydrogenase [Hyphomonas sp.]|jgi:NAD(P)-dependent dehydrogenase (short-subunit alcohol dehydrogenase family)|nr:glucose 1-dehydrogenase [Henriciella sp.]MBO6694342.1 glucose 1-dehydrogenase [Henriciella sp.]MCR9224455.1 glucose 1-dehydrogenase [Hyphomonas sp.]
MADRFDLTGRIALVTGASSGLGKHFAGVLAEAGAKVVLAARRMERLETLAAEIEAKGGEALAVSMDVTKADTIQAALEATVERFGGPADVIVNNSGLSREGFFTNMEEDDFDLVMDTNTKGVWLVARTFAGALVKSGKPGSMINIASVAGRRVGYTMTAYCASKAACEHMTRNMAIEMARYGVRVNAIAPGYFETEINDEFLNSDEGENMRKRVPMRRFGEHEELSGPLLLLASDAGSFMTGTTIIVDGGHMWNSL